MDKMFGDYMLLGQNRTWKYFTWTKCLDATCYLDTISNEKILDGQNVCREHVRWRKYQMKKYYMDKMFIDNMFLGQNIT